MDKQVNKANWGDLSTSRKAASVIIAAIQIGLMIAALWDIRQRPAEQIRGNKAIWGAISLINFVGPISYFVYGRKG